MLAVCFLIVPIIWEEALQRLAFLLSMNGRTSPIILWPILSWHDPLKGSPPLPHRPLMGRQAQTSTGNCCSQHQKWLQRYNYKGIKAGTPIMPDNEIKVFCHSTTKIPTLCARHPLCSSLMAVEGHLLFCWEGCPTKVPPLTVLCLQCAASVPLSVICHWILSKHNSTHLPFSARHNSTHVVVVSVIVIATTA